MLSPPRSAPMNRAGSPSISTIDVPDRSLPSHISGIGSTGAAVGKGTDRSAVFSIVASTTTNWQSVGA